MFTETTMIFQSGQQVAVSGRYELIGQTTPTTRQEHLTIELIEGDYFPYYDGFEVCWLLADAMSASQLAS